MFLYHVAILWIPLRIPSNLSFWSTVVFSSSLVLHRPAFALFLIIAIQKPFPHLHLKTEDDWRWLKFYIEIVYTIRHFRCLFVCLLFPGRRNTVYQRAKQIIWWTWKNAAMGNLCVCLRKMKIENVHFVPF